MKSQNGEQSDNAKRQARFADRQRAMGRKQFKIWTTEEESRALRMYLEELRIHGGARRI